MSGPTVYAKVMENRVADALAPLDSIVDRVVPIAIQEDARHQLGQMFRDVYVRGVIDGFAQGVADAEEKGVDAA